MVHQHYIQTPFVITTTKGERFEVTGEPGKYIVTDTTPPANSMDATEYRSVILSKKEIAKLQNNPNAEYREVDNAAYFDGLYKGALFGFIRNDTEMTVTKGYIDKAWMKHQVGSFLFNIHLFDSPGVKISMADMAEKSISLITQTQETKITYLGEEYFFEGRKVIFIFSMIGKKHIDLLQDREFDVTNTCFMINRPFVIISWDEEREKAIVSVIAENLLRVEPDNLH